ncbi:I78 family peptidase inhibitor [Variovorax sp. DT-64]|uniref:I78 family peptidase inhibitor n=1 Tax=Variovorax sp. DT-64 TaxID=3396160 RepID=UPI003F1ADDED
MSLVLLGACQIRGEPRPLASEALPPPTFVDAPARCTAARARFALGRRITAALLEEMRMRTGARQARLVLPTDPDTPFDAARLIVDIEPNGRVVGVRCS